jgi:hypothetical protein
MSASGTMVLRAATLAAALFVAGGLRAEAQAMPPAAHTMPSAFVQVEGSKLYYETCGTAPQTVVLLHDGGLEFSRLAIDFIELNGH